MREAQKTDIRRNTTMIILAGLILAGFLLAGMHPVLAADPSGPAKAAVQPVGAVAQPISEVQPAAYRYSPFGKADPFKSFVDEEAAREAARKKQVGQAEAEAVNILHRHDTEQYILVGIASDEKGRSAMVIDPTKKYFFVLNVGTTIGMNRGRVKEIRNDQIIIEEKVKMDDGKIKPRRVIIRFQ